VSLIPFKLGTPIIYIFLLSEMTLRFNYLRVVFFLLSGVDEMARVIYHDGQYKILEIGAESFVLVNTKGQYCNHAHFNKLHICHILIKMIKAKRVPHNKRLRTSARRVTTDAVYLAMIDAKMADPKDRYINPNQMPRRSAR